LKKAFAEEGLFQHIAGRSNPIAALFDQDQNRPPPLFHNDFMYRNQFPNRVAAGQELARALQKIPGIEGNSAVFALPAGGAQVAAEVAAYLDAPLYPLDIRKLRIPGHDSLSMGALAPGGVLWLDGKLIARLGIAEAVVQKVVQREAVELKRLDAGEDYGYSRAAGSSALIVGDGISDNIHDVMAALEFVQALHPLRLLIAAPVISAISVVSLSDKCDEVVCLHQPDMFVTADYWYAQRLQAPKYPPA
jgi:putative phosphoribosyl transferase